MLDPNKVQVKQSISKQSVEMSIYTFGSLLFHNHAGVMVRTRLVKTPLSTMSFFLAWIATKRSFLDSLERTKQRMSGPYDTGGKQNAHPHRPLLVCIQSNTPSPELAENQARRKGLKMV